MDHFTLKLQTRKIFFHLTIQITLKVDIYQVYESMASFWSIRHQTKVDEEKTKVR